MLPGWEYFGDELLLFAPLSFCDTDSGFTGALLLFDMRAATVGIIHAE